MRGRVEGLGLEVEEWGGGEGLGGVGAGFGVGG